MECAFVHPSWGEANGRPLMAQSQPYLADTGSSKSARRADWSASLLQSVGPIKGLLSCHILTHILCAHLLILSCTLKTIAVQLYLVLLFPICMHPVVYCLPPVWWLLYRSIFAFCSALFCCVFLSLFPALLQIRFVRFCLLFVHDL